MAHLVCWFSYQRWWCSIVMLYKLPEGNPSENPKCLSTIQHCCGSFQHISRATPTLENYRHLPSHWHRQDVTAILTVKAQRSPKNRGVLKSLEDNSSVRKKWVGKFLMWNSGNRLGHLFSHLSAAFNLQMMRQKQYQKSHLRNGNVNVTPIAW